MKRVAIVFSTKFGQTKKIALHIYNNLLARNISVCLIEASSNQPPPGDIDGFICGSPIYRGRFAKPLLNWIRHHQELLSKVPTAFFSVGLNAADSRPIARHADQVLLQEFERLATWKPDFRASFAGALNYPRYSWLIKLIMRRISAKAGGSVDTSREHEYTNWKDVDAFIEAFLAATLPASSMLRSEAAPFHSKERTQAVL